MKKKMIGQKRILLFLIILVAMMFLSSTSFAATQKFGLQEYRRPDTSGKQFAYKEQSKIVWDIVKYDNGGTTFSYNDAIYCLKAEQGFYTEASADGVTADYNTSYNFRNKSEIVAPQYPTQYYGQLLWILDHVFVPVYDQSGNLTEESAADRARLLDAAFKHELAKDPTFTGTVENTEATDHDIEVAQQMAIWYFTNESDGHYHNDDAIGRPIYPEMWISQNQNGVKGEYQGIDDINPYRKEEMQAIYKYLIEEAKNNSSYNPASGAPISLEQTTPSMEKSGDNYIIGPYKINKLNDNDYTLEAKFTTSDGREITSSEYKLLTDKNGTQAPAGSTIKSLVGNDFYISVPISRIGTNNVTFSINGTTYPTIKLTYWTNGAAVSNTQPLVMVEKLLQPINGEITVEVLIEGNYQIELEKVDKENPNLKLPGAEFEVTIPGKTTEKKVTDENGMLNLGTVEITDTTNKDTILVKETKAPEGYNKILDNMTIEVEKQIVNGSYVATKATITSGKVDGTEVTIEGNTIKIVVANVPIEGNYQIQLEKVDKENPNLKLPGAEFEVTIPGKTAEKKVTDENGMLNLGTVEITDINDKDTILVKETKAPEGYNKILDNMTIEVEKQLVDGSYSIKNATITSGKVDGTDVTIEGNTIKIVVANVLIEGNYQIQLEKVDKENPNLKLPGAEFEVTIPGKTAEKKVTDENGMLNLGTVEITDINNKDTILVKETKAPEGYNKILDNMTIEVEKQLVDGSYSIKNATITSGKVDGTEVTVEGNTIKIVVANERIKEFDLALRKFISAVGDTTYNRAPTVDASKLNTVDENGKVTTAIYNHTKEPVMVKKGDIVTYTIRVYNEGEVDGYAKEITDYLPEQLEFVNGEFNATYGWRVVDDTDGRRVKTDYLSKEKEINPGENLIKAFDGTTPNYKDIQIQCKVKEDTQIKGKITNLAQITKDADSNGNEIEDRDSTPEEGFILPTDEELPGYKDEEIGVKEYIPGQEDDDDFEKVILEEFDLALRKFISGINGVSYIGREPQVDTTNLNTAGNTTAIYNHTKEPIRVKRGDIITYTIRVYNEADIDGYAKEITDYLPQELSFLPEDELNKEYGWSVSEDGRKVITDYLSKEKETNPGENLIKAFDGTALSYREIQINCEVKEEAELGKKITNLAQITKDTDSNGDEIEDRDSTPDDGFTLPTDEELPRYKDEEIGAKEYIPGQEDDDDFEKVITVYFDLALQKFITGVNDTAITDRVPHVNMDEIIKGESTNAIFTPTGEEKKNHPVEVEQGNIVTYTIRIYNQGLMNGYASKLIDDVPEGLEFLPEHETNKKYAWKLSEDEKQISTDYLSKEKEAQEGANLIKAFDRSKPVSEEEPYNPDYRDVQVAFKVTEPNTSNRIIINTAEIADDRDETNQPVEDIDSTPDNNKEEEDDIDKEYIKVKYFDLALKKWVSKAIVIENGQETVTQTGHTGDEDPEPIVKVDLHRKKLEDVTVKFEFQIKVTNEGEIAGYAKEVTDYIPEGLKFVQEDNPNWYTREGNERKVATRALENTLLQPGDSANVSILLTWINSKDNMGVLTNVAEISEDYNDSDTPDIDSTPDNQKPGEDDIDDAPVLVTITLGKAKLYLGLGAMLLVTTAGGIFLIKKYVLS